MTPAQVWQLLMDRVQGKAPAGARRDPRWRSVRAAYLEAHPVCEFCGDERLRVEVHHVLSFHEFPDLELDPENLITLCTGVRRTLTGGSTLRGCHLLVGHLRDYERTNPNVREDATLWSRRFAA